MTWLRVNWRPIVSVFSLSAMYIMAKFWPGLREERELIEAFTEILGLGLIALVPSLRATKRSTDL